MAALASYRRRKEPIRLKKLKWGYFLILGGYKKVMAVDDGAHLSGGDCDLGVDEIDRR